MSIYTKNGALIDLFVKEISTFPDSHSELVAIMNMDMAIKNGGVLCWFDNGTIGIDEIMEFSHRNKLTSLTAIAEFARMVKYMAISVDEVEKNYLNICSILTDGYYEIMDKITEILYSYYVRV